MDPQEMVHCPYNKAHTMPRFRLHSHIMKCKKTNTEVNQFEVCTFNSAHVLPRQELAHHHSICPSRKEVEIAQYFIGERRKIGTLPKNPINKVQVNETEEDWDSESSVSVLDVIKRNAEKKDILITKMCAPKSEKKAFCTEQIEKFKKLRPEGSD